MTWKISLDEANLVDGFFPADYQGVLPQSRLVTVDDEEYKRVLKLMPAQYVEGEGFKQWFPPSPSLGELKAQKKAEIAASRYVAETSGITVSGATIDTDRDSQALITGAALAAVIDGEYALNWKTTAGFIHLSAPEIIAVAQAVRAHVQSCFDREGELVAQVDAAQSKEDLDAIEITFE